MGTPMHGANLFPDVPAGFRECVLDYMSAVTRLGHRLMAGIALSLDLDETYFADRITGEPLTLFRIFNYPVPPDPRCGASANIPTTACSRSSCKTTREASR